MKKLIKKTLEPEKLFEQWALDNSIKLPKESLKPKKRLPIRWIAATAMVFIICLAVILPFAFNNEPPTYYAKDIKRDRVASITELSGLESFLKSNNLLFFSFNDGRVSYFQSLFCDIAIDNENLILSYYFESYSILFKDDEFSGFEVDYRIVTYKNYKFSSFSNYSNLEPLFEDSGPKLYYRIDKFVGGNTAFIKFSYRNCDYFLRIREIEGAGELTVLSLQNFLLDLRISLNN